MDSENQPQEQNELEKNKVPWTIWDVVIALIAIPLITNGAVFLITLTTVIAQLVEGIKSKLPILEILLISIAIQYTVTFLTVLLIAIVIRKASWSMLGFRPFNFLRGLGLMLVTYFSVEVAVIIYGVLLALLHVKRPPDRALEAVSQFIKSGSHGLALAIFIVAVVAPVMEEMFFRGFVYPVFRQRWGVSKAIIFSSLLFALSHLSLYSFIPLAIIGAALAYLYQRTNSLGPSIMLHALNNFMSVMALYYLGGKLPV